MPFIEIPIQIFESSSKDIDFSKIKLFHYMGELKYRAIQKESSDFVKILFVFMCENKPYYTQWIKI